MGQRRGRGELEGKLVDRDEKKKDESWSGPKREKRGMDGREHAGRRGLGL